jgi:hypothetical protein
MVRPSGRETLGAVFASIDLMLLRAAVSEMEK